jgi:hypothetical protein
MSPICTEPESGATLPTKILFAGVDGYVELAAEYATAFVALPAFPVVGAAMVAVESVVTRVFDVGIDVPLMLVAVAAPSTGVTSVGVFAKTKAPEPVSSEIMLANSDEDVDA